MSSGVGEHGGWTWHGGRLAEARVAYPAAPTPWLDLSTGINPRCWPADTVAIDWQRLPEEGALAKLEAAAAASFGVAPRHVCALPGTEIGLRLLDNLPLPAHRTFVAPGYRTHGEAFASGQAIARTDIAAVLEKGAAVLLANPNNPDGHLHDGQSLMALLEADRRNGGWLVVDEAFADATPEHSIAPQVADDTPLLVLRSFGKFFGLAGVRLGFMVGPEHIVDLLRTKLGSWPVSSAAIAIGTAAYRDHRWIAAARSRLAEDAAALDAVLSGHGLRSIGASSLFRLVEVENASELFDRLARRGILIRPFDYAPRWLRFGLPANRVDLERLDRALGDG